VTFSDADFCHFATTRRTVLYLTPAKLLLASHMSRLSPRAEVASYVP